MDAIIRFLQDTGFYLFSQDGNWRYLIMLGIACVLLYLGIVKKFEPLLLVPIAFGMLITNLPGANMFHEIFFAGGHIHWDLIGGQPVTASLLADLHSQGVAENVLAPYIQQLMTAAQTTGTTFLSLQTIKIMAMGVVAFSFGTAGGVLLAKFMNLFLKEKINPLIGSAGVSAVPMAARVSQMVGQKYNPGNFLLMHAMGPNVAGVIGSAIAAGVLISLYG